MANLTAIHAQIHAFARERQTTWQTPQGRRHNLVQLTSEEKIIKYATDEARYSQRAKNLDSLSWLIRSEIVNALKSQDPDINTACLLEDASGSNHSSACSVVDKFRMWVRNGQREHETFVPMPEQTFLDIGCGFGEPTFAAAICGLVAKGIEINPDIIAVANILKGVFADIPGTEKAEFINGDFTTADLSGFDFYYIFQTREIGTQALNAVTPQATPGSIIIIPGRGSIRPNPNDWEPISVFAYRRI